MPDLRFRSVLFARMLLLGAFALLSACGKSIAPENASFSTQPLLDPNTASVEQLQGINGVSAELAEAIINARPIASNSALHAVLGDAVNESNQFDIYSAVAVKVPLNSGVADDIRLIPSTLGQNHFIHEFQEYRPYTSIEQFIKEMNKYVSEEEAQFLARYVILD